MNHKLTASVLLAAFAAFSPTISFAESGQGAAAASISEREAACYQYENGGFRLFVPKAYDDLLATEIVKDRKDGKLFCVSEKASIEAAKELPYDTRGAGWLFSIGQIDEGRRRELLCGDMSGAEIFARDSQGQYYVYYHPTDVRYMREDVAAMKRDQNRWAKLNEWAWGMKDEFLRDNDLEAAMYDNSAVGIAVARAVYQPEARYTVSTTQYDPMEAQGFDAIPYAERLLQNVSYEMTDLSETPDGEYVVLAFPDEGLRYDFFKMEGKENYVREVRKDEGAMLYKATFADGATKASKVIQDWYDALAARRTSP